MRKTAFLFAALALIVMAVPAHAVVLCAKQRSDGSFNTSVKIREACRPRETELDPAALGLQGEQGPAGPQGGQGPPGIDGADGTEGPPGEPGRFLLIDGAGSEIGILVDGLSIYSVYVPDLGRVLDLAPALVGGASGVKFERAALGVAFSNPGCTGQAYVRVSGANDGDENYLRFIDIDAAGSAQAGRFFAPTALVTVTAQAESVLGHGNECDDFPQAVNATWAAATEVTMPFSLPLIRPLQIVPAP